MCTCRHDELRGTLGVETCDLRKIVHGLLREVLARDDAAARELERELLVHAFEAQQIFGRLGLIDDFLADERLRDQHVRSEERRVGKEGGTARARWWET